MDSTTLLIVGIVVALLAFYFYNRSKPAARGTYDDKSARSSGSIGGGTRAYDDESVRSSGSIGGGSGTRAYDAPEVESSGSIGGQPTTTRSETTRTTTTRSTGSGLKADDDRDQDRTSDNRLKRLDDDREDDQPQRRKGRANDDENFKSGGSFGSSN